MKTVKDVVAFLLAQGTEQAAEAANVLLQSLATKELIDDGTLVHVANVGRDFPNGSMSYVWIQKDIDLMDYVNQPMYCRKPS